MSRSSKDEEIDSTPDDGADEFHMVPVEDVLQHDESYACPCQPKRVVTALGEVVWEHKSMEDSLS